MQNEKEDGSIPASPDGWAIKDLAREASLIEEDEIQRQILRGDESEGDPDERDIAGALDPDETPHGRNETETVRKSEADDNG